MSPRPPILWPQPIQGLQPIQELRPFQGLQPIQELRPFQWLQPMRSPQRRPTRRCLKCTAR